MQLSAEPNLRALRQHESAQFVLAGSRDPAMFEWAADTLAGDRALVSQVRRAHGGGALRPMRYEQLRTGLATAPQDRRVALMQMMNVGVFVRGNRPADVAAGAADRRVELIRLPNPSAPAFTAMRAIPAGEDVLDQLLTGTFDPQKEIIVDGGLLDATGFHTLTDFWFQQNSATMSSSGQGEAALFYSDGYANGWRAFVNGAETPVRRANVAFKAIALDAPGEVVFAYDPPSFKAGATLSLGALTLLVVGLTARGFRSRKPSAACRCGESLS